MRMTRQVISFNRHFFLMAGAACVAALLLMSFTNNPLIRGLLGAGIAAAVWFMVASVIASYVVYDASDLYKLKKWPSRVLHQDPVAGVLVHAGFDPASPALRRRYPQTDLRVLDFFDDETTTESSIQRAHQQAGDSTLEDRIRFDAWPLADRSQNAVFLLSAAHELRRHGERVSLFHEAARVLDQGGRIVVIEQLRDAANFACFGVAAFHFLSRRTWLRSFAGADLELIDEFKISPFMTAFVLSIQAQDNRQAA